MIMNDDDIVYNLINLVAIKFNSNSLYIEIIEKFLTVGCWDDVDDNRYDYTVRSVRVPYLRKF